MIRVAMSAADGSAASSEQTSTLSSGRPIGAAENHRRRCRKMPPQPLERLAELPGPRPRDRIVERDDETRARGGVEPALDQFPGLEIVGQRDGAEVMAERRADARGDREHRGDARHDRDIERSPDSVAALDLLAHRRRHREHAGIAARDQRDMRALRGMAQAPRQRAPSPRGCRRRCRVWSGARGNAIEIGPVADRAHRRIAAPQRPPASASAGCPARARRRRASRSWLPSQPGHQDHREIRRDIVALVGEPHR